MDIAIWKMGSKIVEDYIVLGASPNSIIDRNYAKRMVDAMFPENNFSIEESVVILMKELHKLDESSAKKFINALLDDNPKGVVEVHKELRLKKDYIMLCACTMNSLKVVKMLISNGAALNFTDSDGWSPLTVAITYDNQDLAEFLINNKAEFHAANQFGTTPLMIAAYAGMKKIVKLLLEKGADLSATTIYNDSALSLALAGHHDAIVSLLKNAGA